MFNLPIKMGFQGSLLCNLKKTTHLGPQQQRTEVEPLLRVVGKVDQTVKLLLGRRRLLMG